MSDDRGPAQDNPGPARFYEVYKMRLTAVKDAAGVADGADAADATGADREDHAGEEVRDEVAVETPVTLYANGREVATLLCSPGHYEALAVGYLFSEGFIRTTADIDSLSVDSERGNIEAEISVSTAPAEKLFNRRLVTSSCTGSRTALYKAIDGLGVRPLGDSGVKFSVRAILDLAGRLQTATPIFSATGGVHGVALGEAAGQADDGGGGAGPRLLYVIEDVGRHNAADKVIGHALLDGVDLSDKGLFMTGRISSEMLLKAARARIPLVVSHSAPTSLAVDLGREFGVTLVAFARGRRCNVYSRSDRIIEV